MSQDAPPSAMQPITDIRPDGPVPPSQAIAPARRLAPPAFMVQALREAVLLGSDNPTMPEAVFKEFIKVLYDPATDVLDRTLWFRTFGEYRHGVNILNNDGSLMFICPPLIGTCVTRVPPPGINGFNRVVLEAKMDEQRLPALAQRTLTAGIEREKINVQVYDIREAWRVVLTRYGLVKDSSPQAESKTSQATQQFYMEDLDEP
jgi:hypothetical protein